MDILFCLFMVYPAYAHDEDNHTDDVQSDAQQSHEPDHTQLMGVDEPSASNLWPKNRCNSL